jgi:predicted RNA-binding Zn ribbon-like protein
MCDEVRFPDDWLDPRAGSTATDLDLAVLLVNSYDTLEDPPERLHDLGWLQGALRQVGHRDVGNALGPEDLPALHDLRSGLRTAFEVSDLDAAVRVLNPMMREAGAVPALVTDPASPSAVRLVTGAEARGLQALQIRLPVALAQRIAASGVASLGACHADPCRCVFVDRTRARTRKYCCGWCNDRAASRAYRQRQVQ